MNLYHKYDSIEELLEQVEKPALYRKRLGEERLCSILYECDVDVPNVRKEIWYITQPAFHKAEISRILYRNLSLRLGNTSSNPAVMARQHEAFLAYGEDYLYKDFFLNYELIRNLIAVMAFENIDNAHSYLELINMLQNVYHLSDEEKANFNIVSAIKTICKDRFRINLNHVEPYGFDILEEQINKRLDAERKRK